MLDTKENIKETENKFEELIQELGITEDDINSSEYDYVDEW